MSTAATRNTLCPVSTLPQVDHALRVNHRIAAGVGWLAGLLGKAAAGMYVAITMLEAMPVRAKLQSMHA